MGSHSRKDEKRRKKEKKEKKSKKRKHEDRDDRKRRRKEAPAPSVAAKSILVEMLARKPELFGELRPLFGVLDAGQSVAVEGIKDPFVRRSLDRLFTALDLTKTPAGFATVGTAWEDHPLILSMDKVLPEAKEAAKAVDLSLLPPDEAEGDAAMAVAAAAPPSSSPSAPAMPTAPEIGPAGPPPSARVDEGDNEGATPTAGPIGPSMPQPSPAEPAAPASIGPSIGPAMPPPAPSSSETVEADDDMGPVLPSDPRALLQQANAMEIARKAEKRARKQRRAELRQKKQEWARLQGTVPDLDLGSSSSSDSEEDAPVDLGLPKAAKREEWMTQLPERKTGLAGLDTTNRTFKGAHQVASNTDTSVWTDTPADKIRKAAARRAQEIGYMVPGLEGNDAGPTVDPSIQPAADAMKDQKAASLVQAYNSKHRGESLVESYRRQVKEGSIRVPSAASRGFDRERDLMASSHRVDAEKYIKEASGLDSKFARPSQGRTFL